MWNYSDRYSVQLFEYPNTIWGAKKPEYRILFGIEKIRIPNTNTTIRSNYSNSIRIPNYSSHPGCHSPFSVGRISWAVTAQFSQISLSVYCLLDSQPGAWLFSGGAAFPWNCTYMLSAPIFVPINCHKTSQQLNLMLHNWPCSPTPSSPCPPYRFIFTSAVHDCWTSEN